MNSKYKKAIFVKRINRFVSRVSLNGNEIEVYVPNTGRLSELAIPGKDVLLIESNGKFQYRIEYIFYKDFPVMINSSYSNTLFKDLIIQDKISRLKNSTFLRSEPSYKNHRFDFLMKDSKEKNFFIELKSCTLAYRKVASFPDAVSTRASNHIINLAETENAMLIFLILHRDINIFIPNYHTDYTFYKTLRKYSSKINLLALSIEYSNNLEIDKLREVKIHIPDIAPSGFALIVFQNEHSFDMSIEGKSFNLKEGFYISIERDNSDIFKRVEIIKSRRKNRNHLIDQTEGKLKIIRDIPIVIESDIEKKIKKDIAVMANSAIEMDPEKNNILFYFKSNPLETEELWEIAFKYRYDQFN